MIEVTNEEQIERLNARVVELLRERDALRKALEQISRMPATPDDKMNRMSLASAVQIAVVALANEQGAK
jgi:hypothetical protein